MSAIYNGRWCINILGGPSGSFEISLVRDDNAHGKASFGWGAADKTILFTGEAGAPERAVLRAWPVLLAIAEEECARSNRKENRGGQTKITSRKDDL